MLARVQTSVDFLQEWVQSGVCNQTFQDLNPGSQKNRGLSKSQGFLCHCKILRVKFGPHTSAQNIQPATDMTEQFHFQISAYITYQREGERKGEGERGVFIEQRGQSDQRVGTEMK